MVEALQDRKEVPGPRIGIFPGAAAKLWKQYGTWHITDNAIVHRGHQGTW